jgi:hypothetical protein
MTRRLPPVTIALCVAATALCGCQRPLGSTSGPYAPAGSLSPATSGPLIPFGSLNGATRVPPPPTGSTQVSNGYDGQPAAMYSANPAASGPTPGGFAAGGFAASGPRQSSASGARNSMGGMPVIDLTAGLMPANSPPAIHNYATQPSGHSLADGSGFVASGPPGGGAMLGGIVGSGVAPAAWQTTAPNISVPRLRPLDSSQIASVVPLPGAPPYSASNNPSIATTQYRNEASGSPAWQAVQVAGGTAPSPAAANAFEQRTAPAVYASQSPAGSLPSTDPVRPPASTAANNDALLWRNPAVAR